MTAPKERRSAGPRDGARKARASIPSDPRRRRRSHAGVGARFSDALSRVRRLRGRRLWLAIGSVVVILPALAFVVALSAFSLRKGPAGPPLEIEVPPHASFAEVAAVLGDAGLVENRSLMAVYLRISSAEGDFVPGPHLLSGGLTPAALRELLTRTSSRPKRKVTIPEGWNRFQIASRLEDHGIVGKGTFLLATVDPALLASVGVPGVEGGPAESAEGYLFPATYDLSLDSPGDEVVRKLVAEARARWDRLAEKHAADLAALHGELGWDRREVVILASMVEKEAAVDEERALVAGVFLNRLTDPSFSPKRLESDPTSAYGCLVAKASIPSCARFDGKVTGAMNRDKANRYSTYTNEGLPPGPIANPGDKSLEAAMAPAITKYLFFVAKGGGRHTFSETFDDHQKAVRGEH